jgi:hypothetical protein
MSNESVSMRELELESAELLPSRETLCVTKFHPGHGSSLSLTQTQADGDTSQFGLINVALLNGNFDNLF